MSVRRLYCTKCRRLHTELPSCLSPYKHYETEVIEGVVDNVVTPDDVDSEDYPCESTMVRWKRWVMLNRLFIEGYLRMIGFNVLGLGSDFLRSTENMLDSIRSHFRKTGKSWLALINRIIYNSGASLSPFPRSAP